MHYVYDPFNRHEGRAKYCRDNQNRIRVFPEKEDARQYLKDRGWYYSPNGLHTDYNPDELLRAPYVNDGKPPYVRRLRRDHVLMIRCPKCGRWMGDPNSTQTFKFDPQDHADTCELRKQQEELAARLDEKYGEVAK
jgi:hypothetical protein